MEAKPLEKQRNKTHKPGNPLFKIMISKLLDSLFFSYSLSSGFYACWQHKYIKSITFNLDLKQKMAIGLGKPLFKCHPVLSRRGDHNSVHSISNSISEVNQILTSWMWHWHYQCNIWVKILQTTSFTQDRDEVDTCPCLLYTPQICFKTQQLWCNRNGYQSNNVPRTNPRKPRWNYLKASWDIFHKEHPKGKRFYSRSIRQLNGTQAILFHGHRRGWTSHCLWQLCGSSASVLVSQPT